MSKRGIRKCCPEIADKIEDLWGTERCEPYLLELMAIHDSDPLGFSEDMYNQIRGLYDLHRNLD